MGGCGWVAVDHELAGNVEEAEEAWDRAEEIEQACASAGVVKPAHVGGL